MRRSKSMREVVTVFGIRGDKFLVARRSDKVSIHKGLWCGISGYIERGEAALMAAERELAEETGLEASSFVEGEVIRVREGKVVWLVHPFIAKIKGGEPRLDWENVEHMWIPMGGLADYETVPGLREALASEVSKI